MNDLDTISRRNLEASTNEVRRLVERLGELTAILGIENRFPRTADIAWLRRRIANLEAQAATRIDPNDPELQKQPIILGEFLAQAEETSLFRL